MKEIFTRISVRKFIDRDVSKEDVEKLLRAAQQAPSAANQQPWEFVVIRDREILKKVAESNPYAEAFVNAPVGIVALINENGITFPQCAEHDVSAAVENLLIEGVSLGLGTVWLAIAGFEERAAAVGAVLGLPDGVRAFAAVAVGYPGEGRAVTSRYNPEKVHYDKY
ncbi:NADH oxidoreductase [Clostridia bacterium]|nr:NADH oxidoreductase [Clostridia bacterium]